MTIKYVAYVILFMSVLLLSLSANANAGTIRIEGIMEKSGIPSISGYDFPKDGIVEISNNSKDSKICPSNECKLILSPIPGSLHLSFHENEDGMLLSGQKHRLQDDITNGHFTPKKQKLVENMNFWFQCADFSDIQENWKNGTTKYICDESKAFGGLVRTFNQTTYPYLFTFSFELPSQHFVLNGEERE